MTAEFSPTSRPPVSDALISVVLPVYNESPVLAELCQRLRAALTDCRTTFEIIFVNDGSTDGSTTLLDRLARQFAEVRVVHLSRNFGQHPAIHAGLERARGDVVVVMNANLCDPPEAIGELLEAWQAGNDVVHADRAGQQSLWHRLSASGRSQNFGVIDARVVQLIVAAGKQDYDFPRLRCWVGFKQIDVAIEESRQDEERRRKSWWQRIRKTQQRIAAAPAVPLATFSWLGGIALLVFLAAGVHAMYCTTFGDAAIPRWTSALIAISFFTALNALSISTWGYYLVRIYDQSRARPSYLVDRTVNFAAAQLPEAEVSVAERLDDDAAAQPGALELEQLDPWEVDEGWDDAYRHLLDHAQGLLELGALVRSEADDLADRQCHNSISVTEIDEASAVAACSAADEPRVIKLSEKSPQR